MGALDEGAADEFGALMLVLAMTPPLAPVEDRWVACCGWVLPVAETMARPWDAALGEAAVRAPCVRNGIIA